MKKSAFRAIMVKLTGFSPRLLRYFMNISKAFALSVVLSAALLFSVAPVRAEEPVTVQTQGKAEVETITPAAESADPTADLAEHPAPPIDVLPAKTAETKGIFYNINEITHPEIEMTPDKSELVRLDQDVASIIVGNPSHLSVMAESARLLVLVPREAGATYFTALNAKGEVVMQRHVLVAAPKEKYVRVRKSCAGSKNRDCQETSVYYCPDMCHQIIMAEPSGTGNAEAANTLPNAAEAVLPEQTGSNGDNSESAE
jgi:hypothetical protein